MTLRIWLYYFLILLFVQLGVSLLIPLLMSPEQRQSGNPPDLSLLIAAQALLAPWVVMATRIFVQQVDGKPLEAIGVVWPGGRWLVNGVGLAVGMLSFWTLLAYFGLDLEVLGRSTGSDIRSWWSSGFGFGLQLAGMAFAFLMVAVIEEWIFRGYLYSTLRERFAWIHAAGLTALLYGLLLFGSEDITTPALCNILLIAVILAALREASGSVWVGAFFQGSWNFFLGCVLSLPVSGEFLPRLFEVRVEGSEPWTGGEYGPEGSWLLTMTLLALLVSLVAWIGERPPLVPPETEESSLDNDF